MRGARTRWDDLRGFAGAGPEPFSERNFAPGFNYRDRSDLMAAGSRSSICFACSAASSPKYDDAGVVVNTSARATSENNRPAIPAETSILYIEGISRPSMFKATCSKGLTCLRTASAKRKKTAASEVKAAKVPSRVRCNFCCAAQ